MKAHIEKLLEAAELIESYRGYVNDAFSRAPDASNIDFSSNLDQLADQQFKLVQALRKLLLAEDSSSSEADASRTAEEALRITLIVWRNFVELRQREAETHRETLNKIQAEITDLVELKEQCDAMFREAVALHEQNQVAALDRLRDCEQKYSHYINRATAKITGTRAITRRERIRQGMVYVSLLIGILAFIGRDNIVNYLHAVWTKLW